MTADEMILQAHDEASRLHEEARFLQRTAEIGLLRDIIRHLCDPENVPYPMTSPEL